MTRKLGEVSWGEFYDLVGPYRSHGTRNIIKVDRSIIIKLDNNDAADKYELYGDKWSKEDTEYELYNNEEKIMITQRGFKLIR